MEPEGSQEPAAGPCPEVDETSPHLPTLYQLRFNIILLSTPRSSMWPIYFRFSYQDFMWTSYPSHAC